MILPEKKQQRGQGKRSGQRSKMTMDRDGDAEMAEHDNDSYNFDEYF